MKNARYTDKKKDFFEGWYFKHTIKDKVIALIPGICANSKEKYAFIQVITGSFSKSVRFKTEDYKAKTNELFVTIGNNLFSGRGIYLDIDTPDLKLSGNISYGDFAPLKGSTMGPFRNMECNHEIISMHHTLSGSLNINGEIWDFGGGEGYLEKDWGTSFPQSYFWAQSYDTSDKTAVFAAAAKIPFLGMKFIGHTAAVIYNDRLYKFATFRLGKVKTMNKECLELKNGAFTLTIRPQNCETFALDAPQDGEMNRIVYEACDAKLDITLCKNGEPLFHKTGVMGSYESCL